MGVEFYLLSFRYTVHYWVELILYDNSVCTIDLCDDIKSCNYPGLIKKGKLDTYIIEKYLNFNEIFDILSYKETFDYLGLKNKFNFTVIISFMVFLFYVIIMKHNFILF